MPAHILEQLLEKKHKVVTTVRSEEKAAKIRAAHPSLGKDELDVVLVPDIAQAGAFDEVVKTPGLEVVIHTASPFHFNISKPTPPPPPVPPPTRRGGSDAPGSGLT